MHAAGQQLKDARETKGLGRAAVARATKVHAHHIAALEFGNLDRLPDQPTVERWLRAYADYLGLDAAEVVAGFYAEPTVSGDEPPPTLPAEVPPMHPALKIAPFVAAVLIVVLLGWWALRDGPERVLPPREDAPTSRSVAVAVESPIEEPVAAREVAPPTEPELVAEPAPEPAPPPAVPTGRISIAVHGVGADVVDRRLVGESNRFPAGSRVAFFTDVVGGQKGDSILHVWIHDGRVVDRISLAVGGPRWRTNSRKTIAESMLGSWAVEARGASGAVLARSEFTAH